jgi:16S rRNA (adenine1518-N6/adenine1519-N6)-dimethyltransferase
MSERRLPTRKRDWLRLIDQLEIRPSKGRGQNFLLDPDIVQRIVKAARVTEADAVVEIGPGLGILSQAILDRAANLTAIEIDAQLAEHVRRIFADCGAFHLIEGDALAVDYGQIADVRQFKIVANLPYSVGTAIINRFLSTQQSLTQATVMVQREVGERMVARPPDMSILTVAIQVYAAGSIEFAVPPESFYPSPKVDSVVLTLTPHHTPLISPDRQNQFFGLVNAGFRHKRKNIANSLALETALAKPEIESLLKGIDIDPARRAQTLSMDEWLALDSLWTMEAVPINP